MIQNRADLARLLQHADLAGREIISFSLARFRSRVTRELLLIRLRRQAEVFLGECDPIPAFISSDAALEVDASAMLAVNDRTKARLTASPSGALPYLRAFVVAERRLYGAAGTFERAMTTGAPSLPQLLAYLDTNTYYQELGALKFCLPTDLASRLETIVPGGSEAVLAPERRSLWLTLRLRELAMARARAAGPSARYNRLLASFRKGYGYLAAEDVDFVRGESCDAIDARIAALGNSVSIEEAASSLAASRAQGSARARAAAACFARAAPDPGLVALVLLARALAEHEDVNRRGKMRLLRNLRNLADRAKLSIETAGIDELACTVSSCVSHGVAR